MNKPPIWFVVVAVLALLWNAAGLLAVVGGTLGCVLLLLRRRLAVPVFALSLAGVVFQDLGLFVVAGAGRQGDPVPFVLQGLVLVIAVALLLLARRARARGWLAW